MTAPGVGGVSADAEVVIVSDRELEDTVDVFRCLDAANGSERWSVRWPAAAAQSLDYGNSPRATPVIDARRDLVYLLGAFGDLHAVTRSGGVRKWSFNVRAAFKANDRLVWGVASTPLLLKDALVINPGGPRGSLVALDPATGKIRWKTPGNPAAFASMVVAAPHGRPQIVGYDKTTLGGWDPENGRRLWTLTPPRPNDFNVPTPIVDGDRLWIASENNGCRLHRFRADGTLEEKPLAINEDLAPDTHSPVRLGNRLFGVWRDLIALDANTLKTLWSRDDFAFRGYASLIASANQRLLVTTLEGELILVDAAASEYRELGRLKLFEDERGLYAHPALVGDRLYVRGSAATVCLKLDTGE